MISPHFCTAMSRDGQGESCEVSEPAQWRRHLSSMARWEELWSSRAESYFSSL